MAEGDLAETGSEDRVTLALCGDVMTGRGIDQILRHPGHSVLHERVVRSAKSYVALAERFNGTIPRRVAPDYVWGDALSMLRSVPALRIVNLETSITTSRRYLPKGINYKMEPRNVDCLTAVRIDCCLLANNHVLDWGPDGLLDTLANLELAGITTVGAGRNAAEAERPAILELPEGERVMGERVMGGRVIVVACGTQSAGVPEDWAARSDRPGVHWLPHLSAEAAAELGDPVHRLRRPGDIAIASLHWGPNWGYDIPTACRTFAHALIDTAGFDLVFGHSSHHAIGLEVHHGRLIVYGAGDFLNDYEGIGGYDAYRSDLVGLYLPVMTRSTGRLAALEIAPFQIRNFRLNHPSSADAQWLAETLDRESRRFGTRVRLNPDGHLPKGRLSRGHLTVTW